MLYSLLLLITATLGSVTGITALILFRKISYRQEVIMFAIESLSGTLAKVQAATEDHNSALETLLEMWGALEDRVTDIANALDEVDVDDEDAKRYLH